MIITRIIDFPHGATRAITIVDEDGNYNIYINAMLNEAMQKEAYKHELTHIKRGDFDSAEDIQKIEREAHEG